MLKQYFTIVMFVAAIVAFGTVAPAKAELLSDFENGAADYDNATSQTTGLFRDIANNSDINLSDNGGANDYLDFTTLLHYSCTAYDETPDTTEPYVFKAQIGETITAAIDMKLLATGGIIGGVPGLNILDPVNDHGVKLEVLHRNSGASDGRLGMIEGENDPFNSALTIADSGGVGSFSIGALNDLLARMTVSITNNGSTAALDISVQQIDALGGSVLTDLWNYSTDLTIGSGAGELNMDLANNGLEVILSRSAHSGTDSLHFDNLNVVAPIPEPSSLALLACGLIGLLAYAWRKRK